MAKDFAFHVHQLAEKADALKHETDTHVVYHDPKGKHGHGWYWRRKGMEPGKGGDPIGPYSTAENAKLDIKEDGEEHY